MWLGTVAADQRRPESRGRYAAVSVPDQDTGSCGAAPILREGDRAIVAISISTLQNAGSEAGRAEHACLRIPIPAYRDGQPCAQGIKSSRATTTACDPDRGECGSLEKPSSDKLCASLALMRWVESGLGSISRSCKTNRFHVIQDPA